jgi:cytochrome c peroxidase
MNRALTNSILLLATAARLSAGAASVRVDFVPQFNGAPLDFDAVTNQTAAGQSVSVTRLDFLLSNIALRRADGVWTGQSNAFAFISARNGRTGFALENIPAGNYDRLRFHVGLAPAVNHSDAAQYPAGHPLNPQVNGLHWGWMGGYVFLALEGAWVKPDGETSGYSFHLANDRSLMTVDLPADIQPGGAIRLTLTVDKILDGMMDDSTASTHSRANDLLADRLAGKIKGAFTVEKCPDTAQAPAPGAEMVPCSVAGRAVPCPPGEVGPSVVPPPVPDGGQRSARPTMPHPSETEAFPSNLVEIGSNAVPYPLTFSRFFPRPALPADNPLTRQGVELGRRLFQDTRLSVNNSQSCASCHAPDRAFTDGRALSAGAEGKTGARHAPALFNLAWKSAFFWDGRAATLRAQVLQPIQNPVEMHETLEAVTAKLQAADYSGLFAEAFGSPQISADRVARALEQYLITLVSFNSKFDRVLNRAGQFTAEEQRGFELFHTEYDPRRGQFGADCFHCHGGPLLQSQNFANNGLDSQFKDAGRAGVTRIEGDLGKFAVPSLRNVELTAPYMHDGRFATLEEVVEHYCTGVKRSASLDPNLAKHPDGGVPLSHADKKALVAFLKTLTDEQFRPAHQSAVSTTPPEARRSEQHSSNIKNNEQKKEGSI